MCMYTCMAYAWPFLMGVRRVCSARRQCAMEDLHELLSREAALQIVLLLLPLALVECDEERLGLGLGLGPGLGLGLGLGLPGRLR